MKAAPTLEGGLRIDAEDLGDWEVLHAIIHDARRPGTDLASELSNLVVDPEGAEDWREYVLPDLRNEFENQVSTIAKAITSAMETSGGGEGSIWITRDDGFLWYGALNQARLALEEIYQFGRTDGVALEDLGPAKRSAFLRSQFYLAIQSLLLDHVME